MVITHWKNLHYNIFKINTKNKSSTFKHTSRESHVASSEVMPEFATLTFEQMACHLATRCPPRTRSFNVIFAEQNLCHNCCWNLYDMRTVEIKIIISGHLRKLCFSIPKLQDLQEDQLFKIHTSQCSG